MSPLAMIRLQPNMTALAAWAHGAGLVPPRTHDLGYALHVALYRAFGEAAPRPFRLFEMQRRVYLYGYAEAAHADLETQRRRDTDPGPIASALGLDGLEIKTLPDEWRSGRRFDFEVRAWPVVRQDRDGDRQRSRERDVFLIACDDVALGMVIRRDDVYRGWLARELARTDAAEISTCRLLSFRRNRLARRSAPRGSGESRPFRHVNGPDAVLAGTLVVRDPSAFRRLLVRGVGRQRAFGFGMLLLRPTGDG